MKLQLPILFSLLIFITACGSDSKRSTDQYFRENFDPYSEPFFPYQWYLEYTQNSFTKTANIDPDANVHILDAWKYTRGRGVKVAVIDNNFEVTHRDLADNIAVSYNADFNNTNVANDTDESSHGTATAGFVAAVPNGYGMLGTAPDAKLVLISQMLVDDAATIRAFEYAKNAGAKIISNSWGTGHVSEAVASELAALKEQNITIFFASGNNGPDLYSSNQDLDAPGVTDESELPSVIGVGATNESNKLASYSNYGKYIDILAPGGEFLGLLALDDSGGQVNNYLINNRYLLKLDNAHILEMGTSFACPIAAGVAALMLSVNPLLTPDQIRTLLIESTEKIESDQVYYNAEGFNSRRAFGKINASKAVELAKKAAEKSSN